MLSEVINQWMFWERDRRREFLSSMKWMFFVLGLVVGVVSFVVGCILHATFIILIGVVLGASSWVLWLGLMCWEDYLVKYFNPSGKTGDKPW